MSPTSRAWLQIHFCVVLWGFTAILGKLITLPAVQLVWWRVVMVSAALLLLPRVWRGIAATSIKLIGIYAGIGVLVALHWFSFYASIKLSNASVGAICMATCPLFLAWIEPLLTDKKLSRGEVLLGILAIPGVVLVAGGTPDTMQLGIVVGIISAVLVAAFGSLNKRFVDRADPLVVTTIEIATGAALFTLIGPFIMGDAPMFIVPTQRDFLWLSLLAYGCTLLPFALSLVALRSLTAFGTQLATNLEPIYAILLAIPLLGEQHELNWKFYLGVSLILVIVFAYPLLAKREKNSHLASSQ
jgi:drug/metabolite transporter (DMT)-like permease